MSKSAPHPDAEIFALAEKCATANQRYEAAGAAFDEAEHRCADIKPPPALIKTEEDAKMRLFVLGLLLEVRRIHIVARQKRGQNCLKRLWCELLGHSIVVGKSVERQS